MASIVSPKNVGKLMVATALATETTNSTFNATASVGEVAVVKANGAALAAGLPFKVVHMKNTSLTGVDVSDTIDPNQVDYVKVGTYTAEVAKVITVSGFTGTVRDNCTYRVSIRKYDGIQSPENFTYIHGFHVTGVATTDTFTTIQNAIVNQINSALKKMGQNDEIVAAVSGTTITLSGQVQGFVLGKDAGDPIQFDVEASVKDNSPATLAAMGTIYPDLTVATTTQIKAGNGTGKQVALAEYAWNGYETGDYGREMGFPNNFDFTPIANAATNYNSIVIGFHKDRTATNVERQFKELVIAVPYTNIASNATLNAILTKIRTACPNVSVPANLATA